VELPSGLARYITAAGVRVVEAGRADRRRQGKSDPLDAVSAARAAQSGRARGAPKGRDGAVEAIRALMVAKRTARSERIQTINQARALVLTGPDDIRARFAQHATDALVAGGWPAVVRSPLRAPAAPKTRTPGSAAVVEGHLVAVGVRERESAAERPVGGR
jgi:hypothetical protein